MLLSRSTTTLTVGVRSAIQRLSNDPVSAVRYMVVRRLLLLYRTDPEFMWQLIDDRIEHDKSTAVLHSLVSGALRGLTGAHASRAVPLAKRVFDEAKPTEGRIDPQEACVNLFTIAFVHLNNRPAQEILFTLAENVVSCHKLLAHTVTFLRELLTPARDGQRLDVYLRAWELTNNICIASVRKWNELTTALVEQSARESVRAEVTGVLQNVGSLIDSVATDIYFASKAHEGGEILTEEQKREFLQSCEKSLDLLENVGLPSVAHHLVEMLKAFIDVRPEDIFVRISNVVICASEKGGYQYESLAADLLVDIIGHYIAGHKEIFRQNSHCQHLLIKVLDIFVMWPNARKLVYRLEDIYR